MSLREKAAACGLTAVEVMDRLADFAEDPEDVVNLSPEEVRALLREEGIDTDELRKKLDHLLGRVPVQCVACRRQCPAGQTRGGHCIDCLFVVRRQQIRRGDRLEKALRGILTHVAVIYPPGASVNHSSARYIEWRHGMPGTDLWHLNQAEAALTEGDGE